MLIFYLWYILFPHTKTLNPLKYILTTFVSLLLITCSKKPSEPAQPTISITTATITNITPVSATGGGNINSSEQVTARGLCWNTNPNPTISHFKTVEGSGNGSFTSTMTGLIPDTTYYVRVYSTTNRGTTYGNEVSFRTSVAPPSVSTYNIWSVTSAAAYCGGLVSGTGTILEKGVCYNKTGNATILDNKTTDGSGNGDFTSYIIHLDPSTTYYVKAYLKTNNGIVYGEEKTFTTKPRITSLGSIDDEFFIQMGFDGAIFDMKQQLDGKILVGGGFLEYNNISARSLARLNTDGTLDTTFNRGNVLNGYVYTILPAPDGKIYIGGVFLKYNGNNMPGVIRLNNDGSLDQSFNAPSGITTYHVMDLAIQSDGKLLVTGTMFEKYLIRLHPDGTIDNTFNLFPASPGPGNSLSLQIDGKILVGGSLPYGSPSRITPNGLADTSFHGGNPEIKSIALQPDGKIIIGGSFNWYKNTYCNNIARLNSDGSYDSSFNVGSGFDAPVHSLIIQPNGKILVIGQFTSYNGQQRKIVARLNNDGSLDQTFNTGDLVDTGGYSLLIQSNGKILLGAGYYYPPTGNTRYLRLINED